MSFMFKPQGTGKFDFLDYFALDERDEFAQQLRTAQFRSYYEYMPFNVATAMLAMVVLLYEYGDVVGLVGFAWAAVATTASVALGVVHKRLRRLGTNPSISRNDLIFLLFRMLLASAAWALLIFLAIINSGHEKSMVAVTLAVTTIATMSFSTAAWPLGAFMLTGVIVLAITAGLSVHGWQDSLGIGIMLLGAVAFLIRSIFRSTRILMESIQTREQVRQQQEVLSLLLNEFEANGSEWLFEFGPDGRLTFASTRMAETFHLPEAEMVGMHWSELIAPGEDPFTRLVREHRPFRNLLVRVDVQGEMRWLSVSGTPKFTANGKPVGYRGVGSDVTDRHRAAERIAELATFDSLTGLVNRRIIYQELGDMLTKARDKDKELVSLLFVDLDRFKAVNDTLGHGAGDRLLIEVARRMRSHVARHGCGCGIVGRLGGDEFAIVLCSHEDEEAITFGKDVIEVLSRPYNLGNKPAIVGASIGLAIGPRDGTTVEELMRAADLALYEAKGKGRGTVCRYDRDRHEKTQSQHSLELDLRHAIGNNEFYLNFQPVVDAYDERVVGFEALLRWQHPQLGNIPPLRFIPLAEETGLIGEIGAWVLNEACRTAAAWPKHIRCAVNLSTKQFDDPGLVEIVKQTLSRWNLAPSRLELELTESLFLDQQPRTMEMLHELHEMGVGFALDDFGTGYSSLGYLQKIAFRRIKIDRSFVSGCALPESESVAIIQAIVALATRLGMHTIAEGTETRDEVDTMRSLGCEQMQGYYFGRPMSAEDAARLLHRERPKIEFVAMDEA